MPTEAFKWTTQDHMRDQVEFLQDDSFSTEKHCCNSCERETADCASTSARESMRSATPPTQVSYEVGEPPVGQLDSVALRKPHTGDWLIGVQAGQLSEAMAAIEAFVGMKLDWEFNPSFLQDGNNPMPDPTGGRRRRTRTGPDQDTIPVWPAVGFDPPITLHWTKGRWEFLEVRARELHVNRMVERFWITPISWPCPGKWKEYRKERADSLKKRAECISNANKGLALALIVNFGLLAFTIVRTGLAGGSTSVIEGPILIGQARALGKSIAAVYAREEWIDICKNMTKLPKKPPCPESSVKSKTPFPT